MSDSQILPCKYEKSIGRMEADIQHLKAQADSSRELLEEVLKTLKGNGGPGVMTQTALNTASLKRLWWWLGGVSLLLLGTAFRKYI